MILISVLALRFALELALLGGTALIAWNAAGGACRWAATLLAPAAVAVLWGTFLSPKALVALPEAARFGVEALLFLAVGIGIYRAGNHVLAVVGPTLWLVDYTAVRLLESSS